MHVIVNLNWSSRKMTASSFLIHYISILAKIASRKNICWKVFWHNKEIIITKEDNIQNKVIEILFLFWVFSSFQNGFLRSIYIRTYI